MAGQFSDKVILITGAGKEIGRKIALAFAAQGAVIAANDLTPINLDDTVVEIRSSGGTCKDDVFDIAKRMPVKAMVDQIKNDWGRIDILVNCASFEPRASILEMDEWDWQRAIDVNLTGAFLLMQSVGNVMRDQGGVSIVGAQQGGLETGIPYLSSACSQPVRRGERAGRPRGYLC